MCVFPDDAARLEYLRLLKFHGEKHGVRFMAYCLMTNHIHLVAVPSKPDSLARGIGEAHRLYTKGVNSALGVRGYLFQGRFYSCPMDNAHTVAAVSYAERNPVRAGMVAKAWDYPWSSARAHVGLSGADRLIGSTDLFFTQHEWRNYLDKEPSLPDGFRTNFRTGRPLGSGVFLRMAERLTGRILQPALPGRKRVGK